MSSAGTSSGDYWYCLVHHAVEERDGCPNKDRLGPFPTREAAAHALQTIADRQARYDAEDEADRT
jgi:hypothetical protein